MSINKLAFVFVLALPLFAWAQSPFDGTWRFNMSSAQFVEEPETFALQNGEYTCSSCTPKIAVKADGADHRVAGEKNSDTLTSTSPMPMSIPRSLISPPTSCSFPRSGNSF